MKVELKDLLKNTLIEGSPLSTNDENPEINYAYNFKGNLKDVHNSLVLFNPRNLFYSELPFSLGFKNCLVILDERYMLPLIGEDTNSYIRVHNPKFVFDTLIKEYRFDPYEVDENKLKFRRDYKEFVWIDRLTCNEPPQVGMFTQIGKTGDVLDEDQKSVLSIGAVLIEDGVTIGNNVTIYRGLTGYTIIKKGAIISDNCVIHHDAVVSGFVKSFSEIYE
jgi:hypothetical protein